ncbi:proline hydroxylase [Paenibacillus pinisoli]|uniref:Proline hydroxylase n=1 Tax=Paenibacillus pinisoli TaxID=1276110 RepID=A0A3A6PAZ3_9BACL|nr:aspartyl/asparaginyl beta-hydroxylase domain-containing protein [Paenibacillus pinisoli]RJX37527.1 proline hydroxylase [Paenibacillus pinisoli]
MPTGIIGKIIIDEHKLSNDLKTHKKFPLIQEEYDEFSIGIWQNCSLWSYSSDIHDTMYKDHNDPLKKTAYGEQLPYISELLEKNFSLDNLKMVRTRNLVNGMVIPHVDFVELDKPKDNYFRLLIPLEDNEYAFHSDRDHVFRMRKGEVWFIDAAIYHAAANFSTNSRIMLCLDYAFPGLFNPADVFVNKENYNPGRYTPFIASLEEPDINMENNLISSLSQIVSRYNFRDMIFLLAKVHFQKKVPIEACFDWMIRIAEKSEDIAIINKAKDLRRFAIESRTLGERFSIYEWPEVSSLTVI